MKRVVLLLYLLTISTALTAQEFRLATYNIRHELSKDTGEIVWSQRKVVIEGLIRYHGFNIFGVQEAYATQLEDLKIGLPNYNRIGIGREDGKQAGEHTAIFYDTTLFELCDQGNFWLNEVDVSHPRKGWDAAVERICTWGIFMFKESEEKFLLVNNHFDHRGMQARLESARLLLKKVHEIGNGIPLILMGDFNFTQHEEPYRLLNDSEEVDDCYSLALSKYANNSTFNGFGKRIDGETRIDHIFVSNDFQVKRYAILTDTYRGLFPSDHFPVVADLKLR